jgi:hypothetical protein
MGGPGLRVEAEDAFLGKVFHGPFGVLLALDYLGIAVPQADGQGGDQIVGKTQPAGGLLACLALFGAVC